ncbi:MAG: hypothetical protein ACJ79K_07445 [Gemmatimonadaceae bacterium]
MGRSRSKNYPAMGLGEAIERARLLYKQEGRAPAPADVMVRAWGYNTLNGASIRTLSALRQYGLVEGNNESSRLTPRALALLLEDENHPDYADALFQAFESPALFQDILTDYDKFELPSDGALNSYLVRKQEFTESAAKTLTQAFRDSVDLVRAKHPAYFRDTAQPSVARPAPQTPESKPLVIQDLHPNMSAWKWEQTWNLSEDIVASLSLKGARPAPEDVEMLSEYLDLAKRALQRAIANAAAKVTVEHE